MEQKLPIYCMLMTLFCWLQQLKAYNLNYRICTTIVKKWHLIVSMTKTNVMILNAKKKQKCSIFSYDNEVVEVVESYKYLGFLICSNHTDIFHEVYQQLASKERKTSYQVYTCFLTVKSIHQWTMDVKYGEPTIQKE